MGHIWRAMTQTVQCPHTTGRVLIKCRQEELDSGPISFVNKITLGPRLPGHRGLRQPYHSYCLGLHQSSSYSGLIAGLSLRHLSDSGQRHQHNPPPPTHTHTHTSAPCGLLHDVQTAWQQNVKPQSQTEIIICTAHGYRSSSSPPAPAAAAVDEMTAKLLVVTAEPETVNQDLLTTSKSQSIISKLFFFLAPSQFLAAPGVVLAEALSAVLFGQVNCNDLICIEMPRRFQESETKMTASVPKQDLNT